MKVSKNLFTVIASIMILIALVGPLDKKSHAFIKGATEKTIKFHALIAEVKMVLAGLNKINIPFISGHTDELGESLGQAKDYLLKVSTITFSQLMLQAISQTWIFKILLLILFALHLLQKSSTLSAKFLIMFLAINPGLFIYSSGLDFITQKSAIDFGSSYLMKLESQVAALKNEKSQLMAHHQQQLEQISNGEKHVNLFGKLKEDVSYDFKKVGGDVKGGFFHIRLLIHEAGHEMTMKVYNFCTMILFSFLLLPIGYTLMVYVLYKNIFYSTSVLMKDGEALMHQSKHDVKSIPFIKRVVNALKVARKELISVPGKVTHDIEHETEEINAEVHHKISNTEQELRNEIQQLKSGIHSKLINGEEQISGKVDLIRGKLSGKIKQVDDDIRVDRTDVLGETKIKIDQVGDAIRVKEDDLRTDLTTDVSASENKVLDEVHDAESDIHLKQEELEQSIQQDESQVENSVNTHITDARQAVEGGVQNVNQDIKTSINEVKESVTDDVDSAEAKDHKVESEVEKDLQGASAVIEDKVNDIQEEINQDKSNIEEKIDRTESSVDDHLKSTKDDLDVGSQDLTKKGGADVDETKKQVDDDKKDLDTSN